MPQLVHLLRWFCMKGQEPQAWTWRFHGMAPRLGTCRGFAAVAQPSMWRGCRGRVLVYTSSQVVLAGLDCVLLHCWCQIAGRESFSRREADG